MAAGSSPRGRLHSAVILALAAGSVLALAAGCEDGEQSSLSHRPVLGPARVALAASFIGGQAGALRSLLHADLIVQPPKPDSALRGPAAADYLEGLARQSDLTRSELAPTAMSREGEFLLERGTWFLEAGQHTFRSRYTLRWRESPAGWKVTLWRWTLFR